MTIRMQVDTVLLLNETHDEVGKIEYVNIPDDPESYVDITLNLRKCTTESWDQVKAVVDDAIRIAVSNTIVCKPKGNQVVQLKEGTNG